jgi:hypothetical protein
MTGAPAINAIRAAPFCPGGSSAPSPTIPSGAIPAEHPALQAPGARLDGLPVTEPPPDGDLAGPAEPPAHDGALEVLHQREEVDDPAAIEHGEGHEHRVDDADVVVGEEGAAGRGGVPRA